MTPLITAYVSVTSRLVAAPGGGSNKNPWDFVGSPSFGPFSDLLKDRAGQLLALVWIICLCVTAYFLIVNLTKLGKARASSRSSDVAEVRGELAWSLVAVVAVASVPAIYAAIVSF